MNVDRKMPKDYKLTQMYMPFYAACISSTLGFLFFFLSFSSPYWLQSFDRVHSSFLHMGIWSVCFDRFVHPQDYHANVLTGCYWVFDRFFFKIGIWQWLNPYWLIGVQVLLTIAFIAKCCVILILVLYHLLFGHPAAESTMALVGEMFVAILVSVSVIMYGISAQSRIWMPRPDHNFLAWSFGFAILAAISSYMAAGFLYCVSYTDRAAQKEVENFEAAEEQYGLTSYISGRGASASMLTRSLYGGTPSVGGVVVKVPPTATRPEQVIALDSDLRRMDGAAESVSLFTPSVMPYTNIPTKLKDSQSILSESQLSRDNIPLKNLGAQTMGSQNQSTYGSEEGQRQAYPNHPRTNVPSRTDSAGQSYSPLAGDYVNEDVDQSRLSDYSRTSSNARRDRGPTPHTRPDDYTNLPRTTRKPRY